MSGLRGYVYINMQSEWPIFNSKLFEFYFLVVETYITMQGYKVFLEDGGEICEGLTCSYCKLVLKDPVQTSESGLRLCRGCFEKAKKLVVMRNVFF